MSKLHVQIASRICPIGTEVGSREWEFWCDASARALVALGMMGYEVVPACSYFVFDDATKRLVAWDASSRSTSMDGVSL